MSDEIFDIATPYSDVAELGQGYIERADGVRLLLALPRAVEPGEAVRFIVHLGDGTPAFAGAGRSVQVSDQGKQVAAGERYETLVESLVFDERSQPVYDYIVAVRQMSYAQAEADADAQAADGGGEAVYESEEPAVTAAESARDTLAPPAEPESRAHSTRPQSEEVLRTSTDRRPPEPEEDQLPDVLPSVLPEPLPTGVLKRAALAAHWVPAAPRAPQRSLRPTRFNYGNGALPIPTSPPRPELERSHWVTRAERPAN
jgi:hypothetical protein